MNDESARPVFKQADEEGKKNSRKLNKIQENREMLVTCSPVLANLTDPAWAEALAVGKWAESEPNTTLFSADMPCDSFKLLTKGSVRIFHRSSEGRELTLYRMVPGDPCFLSLNALIDKRNFEVVAVSETRVKAFILPQATFDHLIANSPGFRKYVLQFIAQRVHELLYVIKETSFEKLDTRIALFLLELSKVKRVSDIKITHQKIASEIGTTRVVVSRLLEKFEKRGWVKLSRGHILITSDKLNNLKVG